MDTACSIRELRDALEDLVANKRIFYYHQSYLLKNNPKIAKNKKEQYLSAKRKLRTAHKRAQLIAKFPYVQMVAVSGSLSKYAFNEKNVDIDFFITTKVNRLWIARTLLHLFKKLTFIFGKQHDFCMNYFIDENHLQITEQNKFTAIELISLIPKTNHKTYKKLLSKNPWINNFCPNFTIPENISSNENKAIKNELLSRLNVFLMELTDSRWKKKWSKRNYPMNEYSLAFKTGISVSKNHPKNYQKEILNQYESKRK
jgi:hypothetical protein